jgi:predicted RNase H-like HicB family nuclease
MNNTKDGLSMGHTAWRDGEMWLGFNDAFPDYMTQGKTIDELEENLIDIRETLTRHFI